MLRAFSLAEVGLDTSITWATGPIGWICKQNTIFIHQRQFIDCTWRRGFLPEDEQHKLNWIKLIIVTRLVAISLVFGVYCIGRTSLLIFALRVVRKTHDVCRHIKLCSAAEADVCIWLTARGCHIVGLYTVNHKKRDIFIFICPIPIAYSMGQIIKSVCVCLSVCVSVRLRALSRSHFLIDFHQNWHRRQNPQK